MARKLASIQTIKSISPIENADKIEVATVLGWHIVVKKNEFSVGDRCIYCEVDSVMPDKPEYEFLRKTKFRIKTVRLRGCISQGLVLPISHLPDLDFKDVNKLEDGLDVTERMGIIQYVPQIPACISGDVKGSFPSFIAKTDQTRCQVLQPILDKYLGTSCMISEKIDGCLHHTQTIRTDRGYINIGKIVNKRLPVKVLTYNEKDKICEFKEIEKYHRYDMRNKKWISIGIGFKGKGNRPKYIKCTDNHKFYTNTGWKMARDLNIGDEVYHYLLRPNEEIMQMISGCLLGDSSISGTSKNYLTITIGHSEKQKDYLDYKKRLLKENYLTQKPRISGFGSKMLRGLVKTNLEIFHFIRDHCLTDKKKSKSITKKWCDTISPIALAFWYMDDGSIESRDEKRQMSRCKISTQRYSLEENRLLQDMLSRFGIHVEIGDRRTYKGYTLLFDKNNTYKFCSLIAPYVPSSMKYKLPLKYESWKCVFDDVVLKNMDSIIKTKVIDIKPGISSSLRKSADYCYDLSIKDNHNYFTHNILVHNSSSTYFLNKGEFGVCSRNLELKETESNAFWVFARENKIEEKLRTLGRNIALQGELGGAGIQGNSLNLPTRKVYFFDVFDIDKFRYLDYKEFKSVIESLGLETVPILDESFPLINDIDALVKLATGKSKLNPKVWREGIVVKPLIEMFDFQMSQGFGNGRVSLKALCVEYLLEDRE